MKITIYLSLFFLALYLVGLTIRRLLFLGDRRRMREESREGGRVITTVEELRPGSVKKFWLICEKYRLDAFVVNNDGLFYAYVNRCRHMATPLDFVRDQFLSEDRRYLMCYTHGALYEFATGECVAGPCKGELLYRLPLKVDRGSIVVGCPEGDISFLAD